MRPLAGIAVITLEHAIAAPFATRQLADLGARVIKVERPGTGDFARGYDEHVRGLASHFVWANRSKESLTLDVKHPEAQAILKRLVQEQADVVIQSEAGFLSITGTSDGPSKAGLSIADIAAGMYAYSGILAALLQRQETGLGRRMDGVPALGQHTEAILASLGLSADAIAELRCARAI